MTPAEHLGPRELRGNFVALEPLEKRHHAELLDAAADPDELSLIGGVIIKDQAS